MYSLPTRERRQVSLLAAAQVRGLAISESLAHSA